jgi:5-methylcytosine-specific restriction endonuclease McrA
MKPNFSEDVRREVLEDNYYICQYCGQDKIFDFHHRLPNTKYNRKKYPKFLQSRINCVGLCRKCHTSGKVRKVYKIKDADIRI